MISSPLTEQDRTNLSNFWKPFNSPGAQEAPLGYPRQVNSIACYCNGKHWCGRALSESQRKVHAQVLAASAEAFSLRVSFAPNSLPLKVALPSSCSCRRRLTTRFLLWAACPSGAYLSRRVGWKDCQLALSTLLLLRFCSGGGGGGCALCWN